MSEFISNCPKCRQQILCDTVYVGQRVACPVCLQEIIMPAPQQTAPGLNVPAGAQSPSGFSPAPGKAGRKRDPLMLVMIIGAAVLTLGVGGAFLYIRNGSQTVPPASAPAPVATTPVAPAPRMAPSEPSHLRGMPPPGLGEKDLLWAYGRENGAVIVNKNGIVEIFSIDPNTGALRHRSNMGAGTEFGAWTVIGNGTGNLTGHPAAICRPDGGVEVFAQNGTDHTVAHYYHPDYDSEWHEYPLGGNIAGDPAVIINSNDNLEVFATDQMGNLAHDWNTGAATPWVGWEIIGANGKGRPTAIARPDGGAEIFVRHADNTMDHYSHPNFDARWVASSLFGDNFASDPCAIQNANGFVELFCVKSDGTLWHNGNKGTNTPWNGWRKLKIDVNLMVNENLAAVVNQQNETEIFGCQASDHQTGYTTGSGDNWSAWAAVKNLPE
jgi:hypothetical protein